MNKSRIFYNFSEFTARQTRGDYWFSLAEKYFNLQKTLIYSASIKILWPIIPNWILITIFVISNLGVEVVKYGIGILDEKLGLWKKQAEYSAKKEHINPWQFEATKTLENICEKVGAKSAFVEL